MKRSGTQGHRLSHKLYSPPAEHIANSEVKSKKAHEHGWMPFESAE
jgi:hypothetical protein